jgi:uncharacterized membrane protein
MTLNITQFVSGNIGLLHLIASIGALILGTIVLTMRKGTQLHRKIGYSYAVCMTILLITAFMLYNLLYAAFVSEVLTRIPRSAFSGGIPTKAFYNMTGLGIALVMIVAVIFFIRTRPKWENQFQTKTHNQ